MSFRSGKLYKVKKLTRRHYHWNKIQDVVDKKINYRQKQKIGTVTIEELYDVRWRTKPFPWSWTIEFKPNRRFFFHGTSSNVIRKILDDGFKVVPAPNAAHGRMLGDGVYIAYHTNKAMSFAKDDYLLSVMVYAPKRLVVHPGQSIDASDIKKARKKYHIIEARTGAIVKNWKLNNHEICVFDPQRVIPRFIIKLSQVKK